MAAGALAVPTRGVVLRDTPGTTPDHAWLLAQSRDASLELVALGAPGAAADRHDEAAFGRADESASHAALTRKDARSGYSGKAHGPRRTGEVGRALTRAGLSASARQPRALAPISWPAGQTASKTVVVLQRLLL